MPAVILGAIETPLWWCYTAPIRCALNCPHSIDFETGLPRLPTGKLSKPMLRDRYWGEKKSRIL
jgi:hypothetical protein